MASGNEVGAHEYSNVAKLYIRLSKRDTSRQITFYDPGLGTLGTPGFRTRTLTSVTRIMGLAFGYGLRDNIKDAYLFLMRHYHWIHDSVRQRGASDERFERLCRKQLTESVIYVPTQVQRRRP